MEFHAVANIFPMMVGADYEALRDDIAANGLLEPIQLYQGQILDGRNRYTACLELGIESDLQEWQGGDPLTFVISKNLQRRHLNETQRALVASRIANMRQGERTDLEPSANLQKVNQSEAAKKLNVSPRTVATVKAVERDAPELLPQLEAGTMSAHEASKIINRSKKVKTVIAATASASLSEIGKYAVIYADPPWRYEYSISSSRDIENQYPTMALEDICSLPIRDLANEDSILFLWTTNPKLVEAMQVIEAWGFNYRTNMVWVKDKIGMGYYVRQQHELLLIATRGNLPVPEPENRSSSVVVADRTEHSKKPSMFYEIIERMYSEYNKIELFSRDKREGWVSWGNQV